MALFDVNHRERGALFFGPFSNPKSHIVGVPPSSLTGKVAAHPPSKRNTAKNNTVLKERPGVDFTGGNVAACGIQSYVESLPKGFKTHTALVAGDGITDAAHHWGAELLRLNDACVY